MHPHGGHRIHSDGLVYKGAVGCGACSAVLICLLGDDKFTKSKAVRKKSWLLLCVNWKGENNLELELSVDL